MRPGVQTNRFHVGISAVSGCSVTQFLTPCFPLSPSIPVLLSLQLWNQTLCPPPLRPPASEIQYNGIHSSILFIVFEAGGDGLSKALRSVGVGSWHRGPSAKTIPFFPRWSAQASMELQELSEREERGGEVHHVQGATSSFYLRDPEPWHSVCLAVYLSPSFFYFLLPFSLSLCLCASCQHHLSGFSTIRTCFLKQTNEDRLMTVCNIPLCRFSTRLPCRVKHLWDGRENSPGPVDDMFLT